MDDRIPLSTLLSQVLVAFVIEFDSEFEHLVPHRTTNHGSTGGSSSVPWLVSMAMWMQFMRCVPEEGIPAKELCRQTRLSEKAFRMLLIRMSKCWGYVTVSELFVRPTPGGLKAVQTWRPLTGIIKSRWRERFSPHLIDHLRDAMQSVVQKFAIDYPDYLPILGYELLCSLPDLRTQVADKAGSSSPSDEALPILLSKLLLAFAVEFEHDSGLSLAVSANVLRLPGDEGTRVRDLPRLSGVSKEAIAMALRRAEECGLGVVRSESPASRAKVFALTPKGRRARETYRQLPWNIEKGWKANVGKAEVEKLRELVQRLVGASAESSRCRRIETISRRMARVCAEIETACPASSIVASPRRFS